MEKSLLHVVYKAGAITLDDNGNVGIHFSALETAWAYCKGDKIRSGIHPGDHFIDDAWILAIVYLLNVWS